MLLAQLAIVFQKIDWDGSLPTRFLDALFVVDVHVQIGAVLLRQRDSLVVNQCRVLHRRYTRSNRVLDSLRIVRMRFHPQSKIPRFLHGRL